ncbi:MAG: phosphatase PAP2 family protein [Plesiomonas sp.]
METLNHQLFLLINASSAHPLIRFMFAQFMASWMIYLILSALSLALLFGPPKVKAAIITAFGCGILGYLFCTIIGQIFPHPRPFMLPIGKTFLYHKANASFPSGHATLVFSLGFSLYLSHFRAAAAAILLTGVGIGWARVFLGVHFPFDILGAIPVSLCAAGFARPIGKKIQAKINTYFEGCRA